MKRVAFCLTALLLVSEVSFAASAIGNSALAPLLLCPNNRRC